MECEECEGCGAWAETRKVALHYNIGLLVVRFHKSLNATLCKRCISKNFWKFTGLNVLLGWWGIISFFCTIVFLVMNTVAYIGSLGMQPPPADGGSPPPGVLPQSIAVKLQPWAQGMWNRLIQGASVEQVAREYVATTGCREEHVSLYLQAMLTEHHRQQSAAQAPPPQPPPPSA